MAKKKPDQTANKTFDSIIDDMFGKGLVIQADVLVDRPRKILSTTLSLDIALSGGIPEGKVVFLSGKPKAGKTTLCLHILSNAIKANRKAIYFDIERRCDPALIKTIRDLDSSKLTIVRSNMEKVLSAEEWLQSIERAIKDEPGSVIVIDSLAMLSTLSEQSELTGENHDMAGVPKLLASFFRKVKDYVDINNNIVVFLSQYQTNRDRGSNKKFNEKGGMGIQYACSVWINVDWFKLWDRDSSGSVLGQDICCTIRASALGRPFIPCSIPLRFGFGIDTEVDIMTHAENLGLIEKAGSWYTIPSLTEDKFQGLENLRNFLVSNRDIANKLEQDIRSTVLCNAS